MSTRAFAIHPQFVFKDKKPTAVLLDLKDYQTILERLEDLQDIQELERIRKNKLTFRPFEDLRKELGV